eukprot:51181-Rhodomonas_salina.2
MRHDVSVFEVHHGVGAWHVLHLMRDQDSIVEHGLADVDVDGRQRVVEQVDISFLINRSRKADPGLLSSAEVHSLLSDLRLVSSREDEQVLLQRADLQHPRIPRRVERAPEEDVLPHARVEDPRLLRRVRHLPVQRHLPAILADLAEHRREQRRLPGPDLARDHAQRPGLDVQADVLQRDLEHRLGVEGLEFQVAVGSEHRAEGREQRQAAVVCLWVSLWLFILGPREGRIDDLDRLSDRLGAREVAGVGVVVPVDLVGEKEVSQPPQRRPSLDDHVDQVAEDLQRVFHHLEERQRPEGDARLQLLPAQRVRREGDERNEHGASARDGAEVGRAEADLPDQSELFVAELADLGLEVALPHKVLDDADALHDLVHQVRPLVLDFHHLLVQPALELGDPDVERSKHQHHGQPRED